jgi:aminoglycoside phosphotransferase (APT) family kinase protein
MSKKTSNTIEPKKAIPYISEHLGINPSQVSITQFPGGFSNLTYSIKLDELELVLRRPPFGAKISKAHDMVREFSILEALQKAGYHKIPKPILCCQDESILGAPFFVMEKVEGLILRNKIPKDMNPDIGFFRTLSKNTIDLLLQLHQLDIGFSGLDKLGKPEGYIERQVSGWSQRYFNSKTDSISEMELVSEWLGNNLPNQENVSFIHNDLKYDNLVLSGPTDPTIKAVLDWEMATVGDPLMDLGTTLAYWSEKTDPEILKMFNLTYTEGNFSRREVIDYYGFESKFNMEHILFYYVFGLFKVGVIAQQIYKRYTLGFATDPRFAVLIKAVEACGKLAINSIQTQKI